MIDDKLTSTFVYGDEIDRVFHFGNHYLLVTRYDYWEGTSHWFYVLNHTGKLIDMASPPDYPGIILWNSIRHKTNDEAELHFGFYRTQDRWQLIFHPHGFWSFHWNALRFRKNRFLLTKRFLEFKWQKGPPWQPEKNETY